MSAAVSVPVVDKEDKNDTSRHDVQHLEEDYIAKQGPKALEGDGFEANIDEQALKQVKRKCDIRVVPIMAAMYTMALIDRTNLGSARIAGLDQATGLNLSNNASVTILVFYVGYIVFELPSNMVLKKVGPAIWLSALTGAWGLVTLGIGFSRNWQTVAVCRVFLGIFEAGLFPGCLYLLASWYQRFELQKRVAVFYMTGSFLSSFANILCLGLTRIADDPEVDGWKYIFIVQGAITIAIAVLAWFLLVDFPDKEILKTKFLTSDQAESVKLRLIRDSGTSEGEQVTWPVIKSVIFDWRVWALSSSYMSGAAGVYSLLLFLPIVLRLGLGFSQTTAFLLAAPPAAAAVCFTFGVSIVSDKYRVRGPFILLEAVFGIIGMCMIGFLETPGPRYAGAFFGSCGFNGLLVTAGAWQQNNIRGDARRSVLTAVQTTCGAMGGIYSALVFRQQDSPNYVPGLIACCAIAGWSIFWTLAAIASYFRLNKQADRGERILEGSPSFRYIW